MFAPGGGGGAGVYLLLVSPEKMMRNGISRKRELEKQSSPDKEDCVSGVAGPLI